LIRHVTVQCDICCVTSFVTILCDVICLIRHVTVQCDICCVTSFVTILCDVIYLIRHVTVQCDVCFVTSFVTVLYDVSCYQVSPYNSSTVARAVFPLKNSTEASLFRSGVKFNDGLSSTNISELHV